MKGYLLDTNILRAAILTSSPHHTFVGNKLAAIGQELVFLSAISLGEMEFGIAVAPSSKDAALADFRRSVKTKFPQIIDVRATTAESYGDLRGRLFEKYSPGEYRSKRVEQLTNPATSLSLGIQENDLWIAAQASELNLTLVSGDRMTHLAAVGPPELRIEKWY